MRRIHLIIVFLTLIYICFGAFSSLSKVALADTTSNLVGWWKLDSADISGSTVTDDSGNGHTGTMVNSPTQVVGKLNQALNFVGSSNQYVSVGTDLGLNGVNSNLTVSGWVYRYSMHDHGAFFKLGAPSDGFAIGIGGIGSGGFETPGDNLVLLYEGVRWADTGLVVGTGWHHFAFTISPTGKPTVYWDGALVYSDNNGSGSAIGSTGTSIAQIGGYFSAVPSNRYWTGIVDDVKVYNRTLSDGDIATLYDVGIDTTSNLVGWWKFDNADISGSTVTDDSGNGHTGTMVNSPTQVAGQINEALNFVGSSNQYVSVGTDLGFSTVSSISVSGWACRTGSTDHGAFFHLGNITDGSGGDGFSIGIGGSGSSGYETAGNRLILLYDGVRWIDTGYSVTTGCHQFGVSIDPNGHPVVYWDGVNRYHDYGNTPSVIGSRGTSVAQIGGYLSSNPSNRYFTGILDDIRVYGRTLSDGDMAALYNYQSLINLPDSPTALFLTPGNTQVSLSWAAPANNGGADITDYVIDYKLSASSTWSTFSDGVSANTTGTVTGLINGSSYDFRVSAVNSAGQGAASDSSSTTPATVSGAPTAVSAVGGNAQATISFTAPASNGGSAITGYTVTSSPGNISASGSASPIVVSGLTNGTSYTFTVVATNNIGNSTPSSVSNSVTPAAAPDVPTAVSALPGNSQIGLSWNAPVWNGGSAITDYVVEYKLSSDSLWSTFSDGVSTATSSTVTGLINGSSYDFRVSAANIAGQGSASGVISSVPMTVPDAPTSAAATRGNTQASISFNPPAFNGGSSITNYTVISSPGSHIGTGSASPIIVTGLTNGTAYTFTVTATNSVGAGVASSPSNSITPATTPDAPTSPSGVAGNAQATISFTAPVNNGGSAITSYVAISNPGNFTGTNSASPITVTGLTNGTAYTFVVEAVNDVGTGSSSVPTNSVTPVTVPSAPIIGTATPGNTQVSVSFTTPISNGGTPITGYTVTSSPGGLTGTGVSSPIIVGGLTNGTAYTFIVTANNVVGTSASSSPSNSATPVTIPDAPTSLSPTAGNTQVSLLWTAPVNNGGGTISDYIIEYKLSASSTWSTFSDGVSANTTGTVTGLINGSSYDFRVSAANIAGQGSPSSVANAIPVTVPDAPASVSAVAGNAQATITFSSPAFNGGSVITSYTITSSPGNISTTTNTTSGIITGLANGTSYIFTVTATNAVGTGSASSPSNSVIPMTLPGAPTAVSAVGGNAQATISFTAPASNGGSAITGYTVTSSPGNFVGTGSTSPVIVTGLTNGTSYTFTVTASNSVGTGPTSAVSNYVTLSTEPGQPANLAAVVQGSSIGLSWSAPVSDGGSTITDYVIEYQLTTGGSWAVFADGTSANTTATVTGLSNSNSYDFRVSALNSIGQGIPSGSVTATPGEPAQVLIQNFSDLTVSSIGTAIRITNEGSSDYEYQYTWCVTDSINNLCGGNNDIFDSSAAKLIQHGQNFDTTLISVVPSAGDYWFHINVLYGSQSSSAYQSFTSVATYPDAPTSVVATAGNLQASVAFNPPASNGGSAITLYTITSSPGGLTATSTASPVIVGDLNNGTAYTFTVTATNAIGTSQASAPSNSVTPATVPDAPVSVTAESGNKQVTLSWVAPLIDGGSPIVDYAIEYKKSSDSVWNIFADGVSTLTTAIVTGLINNISYDFRVSAVNAFGQSSVNIASTNTNGPADLPTNHSSQYSGGRGSDVQNFTQTYYVQQEATSSKSNQYVAPNNKPVKSVQSSKSKNENQVPVSIKMPAKNEVKATPTEHPIIVPKTTSVGLGLLWIPIAMIPVGIIIGGGWLVLVRRRRSGLSNTEI